MNRTRALVVSLAVGLAAVAGAFALDQTLALGSATTSTTDKTVAQRTRQLDRYEASLRKALARKPPALPAVPQASNSGSSLQVAAGPPIGSVSSERVVYRRSPPVVLATHREDEGRAAEHEGGSGEAEHESEGAGADD